MIPLHSTAIGKCLLSSLPESEALEILGTGPLPAITKKTITDPSVLLRDLQLTRERGYAIVQDENIEGMTSVGALIKQSEHAPLTAISLSFSPYFSKDIDVEEAAAIITAAAPRPPPPCPPPPPTPKPPPPHPPPPGGEKEGQPRRKNIRPPPHE
ncbi:IclR family transcriptional regulator C-terminal domain-containing protein, partial [Mesorhizobium sp. WSM4887]|uniref:IclR family transcriptional regulator domain-containing protein n=1 Tax=Mesorhizobium sp. WSM4887 TaxID=3038543 RepID=UPI00241785E6